MIALITVRVVVKRRAIGVSLAWLMIIYIVPLGGVFAYLLFGELNLGKKRAERAQLMYEPYKEWFARFSKCPDDPTQMPHFYTQAINAICQNQIGIPAVAHNQLTLFNKTHEILDTLIKDIHNATASIHLEFYIWQPGGQADDVAQALIDAANRGVDVKLLLDAAGSRVFLKANGQKPSNMQGSKWSMHSQYRHFGCFSED